jgi:DNA gyrase subunit B
MKNKYLEFYNSNSEYRLYNLKCLNNAQLKYWSNTENRQKQSEKVKEYFCNNQQAKKYLADKAKEQWKNKELLQ